MMNDDGEIDQENGKKAHQALNFISDTGAPDSTEVMNYKECFSGNNYTGLLKDQPIIEYL